ncbi:transposase domain-containing protein [Streptomyces sp. NPDC002561]|uniref:transposase domain-containing protein n=1 Tax=Streptomyces sp. NPDC002561 TaxID=3154418 RepID=UPI003322BFEA
MIRLLGEDDRLRLDLHVRSSSRPTGPDDPIFPPHHRARLLSRRSAGGAAPRHSRAAGSAGPDAVVAFDGAATFSPTPGRWGTRRVRSNTECCRGLHHGDRRGGDGGPIGEWLRLKFPQGRAVSVSTGHARDLKNSCPQSNGARWYRQLSRTACTARSSVACSFCLVTGIVGHHPCGDCGRGRFAPGHLGALTPVVPFELVDGVLSETRAVQRRLRDLPSRVGVYFLLAMCLFPEVGYRLVRAN